MGKIIVFLGGSTVRELANHMIQRLENQSAPLIKPTPHILENKFLNWKVTKLHCDETKGYGCVDCYCASYKTKCRDDWADFEAFHFESNTRVIFSWKPDLFRDSDAVALYTRFLPLHNAVVFIGKGLHDATFKTDNHTINSNIEHLYNIVKRFRSTVRVIMRTPYHSKVKRENHIIEQIRRIQLNVWDPRRVQVIDGYNLTRLYTPYDNHHYNHEVHVEMLNLMCTH